jgi:hypothetical protein
MAAPAKAFFAVLASHDHRGAGARPQALTREADQILPKPDINALKSANSAEWTARAPIGTVAAGNSSKILFLSAALTLLK